VSYSGKKCQIASFSADPFFMDWLKELANKHLMSVSELIRAAVREWANKHPITPTKENK
jgi:Arc/MetJ-type ribon-helix-helix transcriptional regulator